MSKYSFLLQGQEPEYFELLPSLRLRKYGGWLVAESIEQEETSRAQSQATIRAVQLAKKIAATKGISLEDALKLFLLPRVVGEYEGKEVSAAIGRFGPYVKHGSVFVSITKDAGVDVFDIDLEKAIELIEAKRLVEKSEVIIKFCFQ
jgi:DNA topoisomerase-1